jgi:hypothetical protein
MNADDVGSNRETCDWKPPSFTSVRAVRPCCTSNPASSLWISDEPF